MNEPAHSERTTWWEWLLLAIAVATAGVLGFANLGLPSLWHDELIHVYAGKEILRTGLPLLLGGPMYTGGPLHSYLLAGVIALFGDSEAVVRAPTVCFAMLNVLLTYLIARRLFGRGTALTAAFLLATSPWSVAWSRQARFYTMNQTAYLAMLVAYWKFGEAASWKRCATWGLGTLGGYVGGLATAPHGILFLGPLGAYAALRAVYERTVRSRWVLALAVVGLAGLVTLAGFYFSLPRQEHDAIFKEGQLLDAPARPTIDHDQSDSLYYFRFFTNNLSRGYFVLAVGGFALMLLRERRRGLFAALSFAAPVFVLNFLIGYRRHRFMFFAYPFFVIACAYALVRAFEFILSARSSIWRLAITLPLLVFFVRLGISTADLAEDSIRVARGDDVTLAVAHPQWRKPCEYVKAHADVAAILTTSYLPVYHYVGRVDNWYPSRVVVWERAETGLHGLEGVEDLKAFVKEHPKGYFIAEYRRFEHSGMFAEDVAWVQANMKRVDEACSGDITVYAWGM
ncbi:MAG: glycosyltransferase family 39 protein [Candidatus Hydrogenedentes bacterium]|nr:glycosyltransferase family 39 protein [Candidatus Hydrogenedentota bacterium]